MIAFDVSLNQQRICLAGANDLAVLNAIVSASGNLGNFTKRVRDEPPDFSLRVGGLTDRIDADDEHLNWISLMDLKIGDEVTIRIVDSGHPDSIITSSPYDAERNDLRRQEQWEAARAYYLAFREEFELRSDDQDAARSER